MAQDTAVRIEDMLCFAVYSASHAFNRVYKPLLEKLGLTYPQYLTMLALWERDDRSVGALGRALMLESNTLTPLLKRLESMGYVRRNRDPRDERVVRIRLTEAGRALQSAAGDIPRCILEASGLTLPELMQLQGQMTALRDALDAYDSVHAEVE